MRLCRKSSRVMMMKSVLFECAAFIWMSLVLLTRVPVVEGYRLHRSSTLGLHHPVEGQSSVHHQLRPARPPMPELPNPVAASDAGSPHIMGETVCEGFSTE
eukprot:GHVU01212188.1.p1 GENE.GHVU01212188.1~~GHVU01212188.1.p1  ORF type:complete len:101 (-),score=0.59 GHVU01212188.1:6-308(-)